MHIDTQSRHNTANGRLLCKATLLTVLIAALIAPVMADEFVVNGDFESDPFDSDWSYSGNIISSVHQGLVSHGLDVTGTQAAYLATGTSTDAVYQDVESYAQWQFDILFAAESPGAGTRSLNMTLGNASNAGLINLRLDPDGKLYVYDTFGSPAKGWFKVSDDLVSFSVDGNGDNSFDDVEDTLNVHSLRIVGDYSVATPYYDMYLSAANSSELVQIASGLTRFHLAKPTIGSGLDQVRFAMGASTGDCLVDKVSLTGVFQEPLTELNNGNFEATPFDDGWINGSNAASSHRGLAASGLDAVGTQSALLQKVTGSSQDALYQYNLDMGSLWELDFLFASDEISAGGTRSLNFTVSSDNGFINIRLDPNGTLYAYDVNDTSWHQLSSDTVEFSHDGNGDGDFEDAGDTLNVHSLRIVGNYESDSPYYNVYLSDANSGELELIAANVQHWYGGIAETGDVVSQLRFASGASDGVYLLDEVSLAAIDIGSLIPGDANGDGVVNAADAAALATNWLQSGKSWLEGDFSGDGVVNDVDATMLASNWTSTAAGASVPEPSALMLSVIGGLMLAAGTIRRKRTIHQ